MTRKVLDVTQRGLARPSVRKRPSSDEFTACLIENTPQSPKASLYAKMMTYKTKTGQYFFGRRHITVPALSAILTGAEGLLQGMMGIKGESALWEVM